VVTIKIQAFANKAWCSENKTVRPQYFKLSLWNNSGPLIQLLFAPSVLQTVYSITNTRCRKWGRRVLNQGMME